MNRYIKFGCLLLALLLVVQAAVVPANARPRTTMVNDACQAEGKAAAPAQSVRETLAVEETVPAETVPAEEEKAEQPLSYDEVPLYYQTDYPDTMYANGTIATSGCSITSLAMVASYMTGHTYLPDELAGYFGGYVGNNMERLEYASDQLQLVWEKAGNFHDALRALEEGKVVIALMTETSIFTDTQHFIVLAGMTVDGKILVNDPNEKNYSNWRLKNGFANGFGESDLCWGFSGGWIYDKSAMPSESFIYTVEEKEEVECRYPDLVLTEEDKELLAKLLWQEARGEPVEGQQAVAEVIFNRLVADNFPDTMKGIVYAEGQFPNTEDLKDAKPTQTQYEAIEAAFYGPYVVPIDVVFYARFKTNSNVWGKIGDHWFCYQWWWKDTDTDAETETTPETTAATEPKS